MSAKKELIQLVFVSLGLGFWFVYGHQLYVSYVTNTGGVISMAGESFVAFIVLAIAWLIGKMATRGM